MALLRSVLTTLMVCFFYMTNSKASDCSILDNYVVIAHPASGLVLEARSNVILIEKYNGSASQQWSFKLSRNIGLFNIVNRSTGTAIDVNVYVSPADPYYMSATISKLSDRPGQQWFINSDYTIANYGFYDYVLNIPNSNYNPGNFIILYPHSDDGNVKFVLQLLQANKAEELFKAQVL